MFVKNRGNVKEMARESGESYWAIRSKINELIQEFGFEVKPEEVDEEEVSTQRQAILEQLNRGEISAVEAAELLSQLK